jgi:hypothetical protein
MKKKRKEIKNREPPDRDNEVRSEKARKAVISMRFLRVVRDISPSALS